MISTTVPDLENLTFKVEREMRVKAPIDVTFAALLEQLGPGFEKLDGEAMPFKLEAWPGGRWFRDLGNNNGHCWGTVQSIKSPTLIEFTGPLMMSFAVTNNVQYRLSEENGETVIKFQHLGMGIIPDSFKGGMPSGWDYILEHARQRAEAK